MLTGPGDTAAAHALLLDDPLLFALSAGLWGGVLPAYFIRRQVNPMTWASGGRASACNPAHHEIDLAAVAG